MAKGYSIAPRLNGWHVRVRYQGLSTFKTFKKKSNGDVWGRQQVTAIDAGKFKSKEEVKEELRSQYTLGEALNNYIEILPTRTKKEESRKKDCQWKKRVIDKYQITNLPLTEIDGSALNIFVETRRNSSFTDGQNCQTQEF